MSNEELLSLQARKDKLIKDIKDSQNKYDALLSSVKSLHNEELQLISHCGEYRKKAEDIKINIKELENLYSETKNNLDAINAQIAEEKKLAIIEQEKALAIKKENQIKQSEFIDLAINQERISILNKEIAKKLVKKQEDIEKREKSLIEKTNEMKVLDSNIKKNKADIDNKLQEVKKSIDRVEELNLQIELKKNEIEKTKLALNEEISIAKQKNQSLDLTQLKIKDKEREFNEEMQILKDAKVELEKDKKRTTSYASELDAREKEINIKELRVKKLIKDHDIAEELDELEKAINSK